MSESSQGRSLTDGCCNAALILNQPTEGKNQVVHAIINEKERFSFLAYW